MIFPPKEPTLTEEKERPMSHVGVHRLVSLFFAFLRILCIVPLIPLALLSGTLRGLGSAVEGIGEWLDDVIDGAHKSLKQALGPNAWKRAAAMEADRNKWKQEAERLRLFPPEADKTNPAD